MRLKDNRTVDIKQKLINALVIIGAVVLILFLLSLVGVEIYTWIAYAGKPSSEIPGWVWWFWFSGN